MNLFQPSHLMLAAGVTVFLASAFLPPSWRWNLRQAGMLCCILSPLSLIAIGIKAILFVLCLHIMRILSFDAEEDNSPAMWFRLAVVSLPFGVLPVWTLLAIALKGRHLQEMLMIWYAALIVFFTI